MVERIIRIPEWYNAGAKTILNGFNQLISEYGYVNIKAIEFYINTQGWIRTEDGKYRNV